MRIFLTGASGFVGSNFAQVFADRHDAPRDAIGGEAVPCDTRLDGRVTAAALDVELPGLDEALGRLRSEPEEAVR